MESPKPHFVVVPLMAQGHMIPMADFSLLLANHGAAVSLITTAVNAARLRGVADVAAASRLPLRLVPLPFPCAESGLPPGCENVDLVPHVDLMPRFFNALKLLAAPLTRHLLAAAGDRRPTVIISDQCMPWTAQVAGALGVPRIVFQAPSCFFLLCTFKLTQHNFYNRAGGPGGPGGDREVLAVPGLPASVGRVEVTRLTARRFFDFDGFGGVQREMEEGDAAADGLVLNTFEELEGDCVEEYGRAAGKAVWAVGPVSNFHKSLRGKAARGGPGDYNAGVLEWLEKREVGSVVFVSFGTFTVTRMRQMVEVGGGLEAAGRGFVWAVKRAERSEEGEKWLSEFEERVKNRGVVVRGWAPQAAILAHSAVGGFMTHCGWNSTLEAVAAGVVMATWPHLVDQFLNEWLVVDVLGIGVRVGVKGTTTTAYRRWEGEGEVVGREEVRKAVEKVMDGGKEGDERRRKAGELGEKARKAMEEGGSSFENLKGFVDHAVKLGRRASLDRVGHGLTNQSS